MGKKRGRERKQFHDWRFHQYLRFYNEFSNDSYILIIADLKHYIHWNSLLFDFMKTSWKVSDFKNMYIKHLIISWMKFQLHITCYHLKKCTKNENNNNNEKFENVSHSIQVQSWLFIYNNYFSRFHRLKRCLCNRSLDMLCEESNRRILDFTAQWVRLYKL